MLNGAALTVVGVVPAGFTGLMMGTDPDFWAPLAMQERFRHRRGPNDRPRHFLVDRCGKDAPNTATRRSVQAEMHVLAKQVAWRDPRNGRCSGCGGISADDDAGARARICRRVYGGTAGGVCAGASDSVHQCGQPAAGAGNGTGAGDGDARGAGRGAGAAGTADASGEPDAGRDCRRRLEWRSPGSASRHVNGTKAGKHSPHLGDSDGLASGVVYRGHFSWRPESCSGWRRRCVRARWRRRGC